MNCDAFLAGLADFVAGELDAAAAAAAGAHVAQCDACRAQAEPLVAARGAAERLVPHREHAEARTALLAMRAADRTAGTPIARRMFRPLAMAALLALAFGLGYAARSPAPAARPGDAGSPASSGGEPSTTLAQALADAARLAPDKPPLAWALLSISRP
jgi:anti-sigma factor RsiW